MILYILTFTFLDSRRDDKRLRGKDKNKQSRYVTVEFRFQIGTCPIRSSAHAYSALHISAVDVAHSLKQTPLFCSFNFTLHGLQFPTVRHFQDLPK
jgi:hypothetical protein